MARGAQRHLVSLKNPGDSINDGQGNSTTPWFDLNPATAYARVEPATASSLERVTVGAVMAVGTHIVTMDYHPQVNTKTRMTFEGRTLYVKGVHNWEERDIRTIAVCQEVLEPMTPAAPLAARVR
jgi:head-tail adaptor